MMLQIDKEVWINIKHVESVHMHKERVVITMSANSESWWPSWFKTTKEAAEAINKKMKGGK